MSLNDLCNKHPHLFQFLVKEFESVDYAPKKEKQVKVEYARFNSKHSQTAPLYKPISKMIELKDENIKV